MTSWCNGKVILITGSSSGIGEEIAHHFARMGARVVITGRDVTRIQTVARECDRLSPSNQKSVAIVADLMKADDVKRLMDTTISQCKRLDILVNNAGVCQVVEGIEDPNILQAFERIMKTNLTAVIHLCHLAVPHLEETGGSIINVSSVAAKRPMCAFMPYSISKSAVDMLTQCLALELGPRNIRVNSVNPALIDTPLIGKMGIPEGHEDAVKDCAARMYPLGRVGKPQDVAQLIEYLASPSASFMTGVNVVIDGGALLLSPKL